MSIISQLFKLILCQKEVFSLICGMWQSWDLDLSGTRAQGGMRQACLLVQKLKFELAFSVLSDLLTSLLFLDNYVVVSVS